MAQVVLAWLAAVAVFGSGLPLAVKTGWAIVCTGWLLVRWRHGRDRLAAKKRQGLRYRQQSGWQLWRAETGWQSVRVLAGSVVTGRLVVVCFCYAGERKRRSLVVPPDVLDADSHRRLRLWLRLVPLTGRGAEWFPAPSAGARDNPG